MTGAVYEDQELTDSELESNIISTASGLVYLQEIQDISDYYVLVSPAKRNFWAVFGEDIWDITDDLRLTVGARYDHYSDFGGSFNPRAGLTWKFHTGYVLKLLYGTAFRAPAFWELYYTSGGNPDLKPERVISYEIGLQANPIGRLSFQITGFYNHWKNKILFRPDPKDVGGTFVYLNVSESNIPGFEFEIKYDFGRGSYLSGNYTYKHKGQVFPKHTGTLMVNVRLSRYLNFNAYCVFRYGLKRWEVDERDEYAGEAIVNATLIARKFVTSFPGLELRGAVYNLFNKKWKSVNNDGFIADDYPMPGLTVMVEARYKF